MEQNPEALDRRMSRFEQAKTPLHFAIERNRHDILSLLIELGADLEAAEQSGQTALALALLRGDDEATARLRAAGAKEPPRMEMPPGSTKTAAALAHSISKGVPMIPVPDIAATLDWYTSIGFKEIASYEEDGIVNFGMLAFGKAEFTLRPETHPGPRDTSLWFCTNTIDALYRYFKSFRSPGVGKTIAFAEDLYDTFYRAREFGIRDLNGYVLYFIQHVAT